MTVPTKITERGITLTEVIITVALIGLFFVGLFSGIRLMLEVVSNVQAEAGALAIAVERLEYIKSLDYFDAGTQAGVVNGSIPDSATSTLNGIEYTEEISIQYFDRPDDGLATDTIPDDVPEDSKRVEITVSWQGRSGTSSIEMQAHLIPQGIESTEGGGTIIVNVFDANFQPVSGATVTVYNDSFSTIINDTYFTDTNGRAQIGGAPAGSNYQLFATAAGYSTDQTYVSSSTNPIPSTPPISVATGTVSTLNFQIDELSDLTVRTIGSPVKSVFTDSFSAGNLIASTTNTEVTGGGIVLTGGPSTYESTGSAYASVTAPTTLGSWESFDFDATTTASTTLVVRVYAVTGTGASSTFTIIPDSDLAGNSLGFASGPVNITSVASTTYPRLALGAFFTSSSSNETAELYEWSLTHIESEPPIGNIPFDLTGAKTIGTDSGSNPVYKYEASHTTDGNGSILIPDLEFDGYTFDLTTGSYSISEIIGGDPYEKQPGVDETVTLVLNSSVAYSLRTTVNDIDNNPIGGATVRLYDGVSYDTSLETSIYGQVFFDSGLASSTYTIEVSADGYQSAAQSIAVDGNIETIIQLVTASGGDTGDTGTTTASTYLAGYDTRVPVSIDGSVLFASVTDFPVYVDLADLPASFFSTVQSDGRDVRVTDSDGQTEVPFELVTIDTTGQTGELHFSAPSLSISTTSNFYIYYGSSTASAYSAGDTYGRNNVWSNGYQAIYHFEEDASGVGTNDLYVDATGNGYDGDDQVSATGKSGVLGSGQTFSETTTDYIELPYTTINGLRDITVSVWFRSTDDSNLHTIMSAANSSTDNEHTIWIRGDIDNVELFAHGTTNREEFWIADVYDNVWRHFTVMKDDTNNDALFFLNGVEDNDSPDPELVNTISVASGGLFIGQEQDSVGGGFATSQSLNGDIDELRISNTTRTEGWLRNSYENQNNPSGFYTVGSQETE